MGGCRHEEGLEGDFSVREVRREEMKMLLISIFTFAAATSYPSFAQAPAFDQLAQRAIERRAVEAVNWGMAAVVYDLMLQEMLTKTAGKVNQFIYWSHPLDWHNQTLTPNPDAIYLMAFFNTKEGPIVVEVPPADRDNSLNANFVDVWQIPLEWPRLVCRMSFVFSPRRASNAIRLRVRGSGISAAWIRSAGLFRSARAGYDDKKPACEHAR
jgi:hypothetical protein